MSDNRMIQKLEKINSPKEEIVFKMEYKGKTIHQKVIELADYSKEIIEDEDMSFYYFFKDMANKLEEKIDEMHKKKMWDSLKEEKIDNGAS